MTEHDDLYSATVLDASGVRIGGVSQVYLDNATGEPTFVTARTGLFGNKEVCVPLSGALMADGLIQVPQHAETIKQAPGPGPDRRLSAAQEAELYRYYALPYVDPDTVGAPEPEVAAEPLTPAGEHQDPSQLPPSTHQPPQQP